MVFLRWQTRIETVVVVQICQRTFMGRASESLARKSQMLERIRLHAPLCLRRLLRLEVLLDALFVDSEDTNPVGRTICCRVRSGHHTRPSATPSSRAWACACVARTPAEGGGPVGRLPSALTSPLAVWAPTCGPAVWSRAAHAPADSRLPWTGLQTVVRRRSPGRGGRRQRGSRGHP